MFSKKVKLNRDADGQTDKQSASKDNVPCKRKYNMYIIKKKIKRFRNKKKYSDYDFSD